MTHNNDYDWGWLLGDAAINVRPPRTPDDWHLLVAALWCLAGFIALAAVLSAGS